ncbi:MAG: QWxxN domain [Enterococcus sp.]
MPQKVKMTKKIRLPQANSREVIGKGNNKRNDKNKSRNDQAKLNYIANNTGQTPTPDGLLTLDGFLYLSSICQNARLVDPPKQQTVIKKNAPAFEANTRIDVRRNGNQTRIHSFVSTSTINRERIQSLNTPPTMPHQSTSIASPFISTLPFSANQTFRNQTTSTPEIIDVAKIAHELSISVHQRIHNIYQLLNCTTTRRTDQVNTLILTGESVEQTSIQTVCQDAVVQAERQNGQGMKQKNGSLPLSSDPTAYRTVQETSHFSVEEVAQKLSKSFQAAYENKQNATKNDSTYGQNQVIETIWKGLTDLFYQFFSQHEQVTCTQEQNGKSGDSVMSYFVDWIVSTFSLNYGEQIPNQRQPVKNLQIPMSIHPTDHSFSIQTSQKKARAEKQKKNDQEFPLGKELESVSGTTTVLFPEEESFLSQFWQLAEEFFGRVDGFIQQWDGFKVLGTEAKPIVPSLLSIPVVLPLSFPLLNITIPNSPQLKFEEPVSNATALKLNSTVTAYLEGKSVSLSTSELLPPFWSDLEVFKKRSETDKVNEALNKLLCDKTKSCGTLTGAALIIAIEKWQQAGISLRIRRRDEIAKLILQKSGLIVPQKLTLTQVRDIIFQWRYNNIFKGYTFKKDYRSPLDGSDSLLQFKEGIPRDTLAKLNNTITTYMDGRTSQEALPEDLPPFWYDLEVFKKRDELEKVNKAVYGFLCKQEDPCSHMSDQQLLISTQNWLKKEGSETEKNRKKQVANVILETLGLGRRDLEDTSATDILLQWRNNNIFKNYKFKGIEQVRIETTTPSSEDKSSIEPTKVLDDYQLIIEKRVKRNQMKGAEVSKSFIMKSYEKLSLDILEKINKIISDYLGDRPFSVLITEELPPFWYDFELYQRWDKTEKVNQAVQELICEQKASCINMTNKQILIATQIWIGGYTDEVETLKRKKQVANKILEISGLSGEAISDARATMILLQWRDNNIFKDFKFKNVSQTVLDEKQSRENSFIENYEVTGTIIRVKAASYGTIPREAMTTINSIREVYLDNRISNIDTSEPLLPIWYDLEVYQKRGETDKANESVKKFLCEEDISCEDLSNQQIVHTANKWINKAPKDSEILEKQRELALLILDGYGITDRDLSDMNAVSTILQWENNNALEEYTWIVLKQQEFDAIKYQDGSLAIISELKEVPVSDVDTELTQVHKTVVDLINDVIPLTPSQEALPVFYYDYELFQKRNKTIDVNKKLKEFLMREGVEIKALSYSELEKGFKEWIEKGEQKEPLEKTGRRQYLVFFILNAYGVENTRLGEFMSFPKMNGILMQWTINTLLVGRTYKKITIDTIHHHLMRTEHYMITDFKKQKKESEQIYADFINDRTNTVPKEQPLIPIYANYELFKHREKTAAVNDAIRKFLLDKKVSFANQSASELVRKLRGWIFEGELYAKIVEREIEAAKLIRKTYGLPDKIKGIYQARNILLQWVDNNAQTGYTYKDLDKLEETSISHKIKEFIRKNSGIVPKQKTSEKKIEEIPELSQEQKEEQRKKIIAFLIESGVKSEDTTPDKLVRTIADWTVVNSATQVAIDMAKIKQLAEILLEKPQDGLISEAQALNIVTDWMWSIASLQQEEEKQQEITSTPKPVEKVESRYDAIQWRDSNVMGQVEHVFRQNGLLTGSVTKEKLMIAMGKWFTEEGKETVLGHEKLKKIAKVILKELKLYGGEEKEELSDKDIELTVTKWVFEFVLGSPVEAYVVKKILAAPDPSVFTIGDLRKLFEVDELVKAEVLALETEEFSQTEKLNFKKVWVLLVAKTLPNYFLETSGLEDELLISDYGSLMQLMGTKFLDDLGHRSQFKKDQIRILGEFLAESMVLNDLNNLEVLRYILIPVLLATAQLEPDLLQEGLDNGNYQEVALTTFMSYWQNGYFRLVDNQEIIQKLFDVYQGAVAKWRRKKVLAEEAADKCLNLGFPYTKYMLEQTYLGGKEPCPGLLELPRLEDVYIELTRAVSDAYHPFDKMLVEYATNSFDASEYQYIFSPETHTYLAHAKLESKIGFPGRGTAPPFPATYLNQQVVIELAQCDLFVAVQGNEERWYALKKLEGEGGYIYYRVDKDPRLYLKLGLFDQTKFKNKGYKIEGDSIRVGNRLYTFSVRADRSKKLSHGDDREKFIETLSLKHSNRLYDQLYDSGNDKTRNEKIWDVIKHFIPFYECIEGIANRDVVQAVPSCVIDAVLLIPVFGQITALNARFALGVARAIATGGIRNGILEGARLLPKLAEIKMILKSIISYLDPGLGLLMGGGKLVVKGIVKLKDQAYVSQQVKSILEKLEKLEKLDVSEVSKEVVMAHLPGNGPEIPVKLIKDHLYMRITNLKTVAVAGRYFVLKGNQLEDFRGTATFTPEQLSLIKRLEVKIDDPRKIFVVEPNVNSRAYGEGPVWTLAYGEGTELKVEEEAAEGAKYFIKMKHYLIPIRIKTIESHGVRYDVVDGENIYPVNYNGIEWYFEPQTSPFISKELADEVAKKIDEFESLKDPTTLSPPYERDLMYNEEGRTYIKINNVYIPLILFDRNRMRYHLVKKDIDAPMMVLRFDPNSNKFKMETLKEKVELKVSIQGGSIKRRGKAQTKWKSGSSNEQDSSAGISQGTHEAGPGTSHGSSSGVPHGSSAGTSQAEPSTSTGAIPKVYTRPAYIPAIDFPALPDNWDKWIGLRHAQLLPNRIKIPEDANIDLTKLSEFPPRGEAYYKMDEDSIQKNVYKAINENFPRPIPKLEVFTGLDSTEIPNSLKLFFERLRDDFKDAQVRFDAAILLFKSLREVEDISSMKEGKYLIEMFKLQNVPEKEAIIRESIKKLYSVADNGRAFLQKSKDLFFQNVWTLSSKLIYDREDLSYYSTVREFIKTEAFTVRYDGECRIFILADAFHLNPKVLPGAHIQPTGYETVMHEVTHIMSDADDLLRYGLVRRGLRKNGKRTLDYYDNKYPNIIKEDSEQLKHYRDHLAIVLSSPNLTVKMVSDALEVNHTLRVHFQLTDAEMLMTILRDLVEGRAFDDIFRAKRESDKEHDEKKNDPFETIKEQLGTGDLFALQALIYTIGFINFEREVQQSKTQEKTTDIPEPTNTQTTNSPTTGNRNKREIASATIESAESTTNQSLLKLINQSIERSNYPNHFVSDQPVRTELRKNISKRSSLNLVPTNAENNPSSYVSEQPVDTAPQKNTANRNSLNHETTNTENNFNHFVSDPKISTGLPKDAEKKSFLDIVFTSRKRSTQNNPKKGFNPLINKNQKALIPQL